MFKSMDDKFAISSENWNLKINHTDTLERKNWKIQLLILGIQHLRVTAHQKQQHRGKERQRIWEMASKKLTGV